MGCMVFVLLGVSALVVYLLLFGVAPSGGGSYYDDVGGPFEL